MQFLVPSALVPTCRQPFQRSSSSNLHAEEVQEVWPKTFRYLFLLELHIAILCSQNFLAFLLFKLIYIYILWSRIGVRSEDVKDFLERLIKGSSIALSSPRLVIPASIYGFWFLSHHYIVSDFLDFQVTT